MCSIQKDHTDGYVVPIFSGEDICRTKAKKDQVSSVHSCKSVPKVCFLFHNEILLYEKDVF